MPPLRLPLLALASALALAAGGCRSRAATAEAAAEPAAARPAAARAFYYWRTTFALSPAEERALRELHVDRLYVRMFDLAWDAVAAAPAELGAIAPAADAHVHVPTTVEIVPVVFLRDEVLRRTGVAGAAALAARTWRGVQARAAALGIAPRELQLDCDWTDASRDAFFAFVRALRTVTRGSRLALSATIRLHQVKYRERTGVPPVDRGMLMFYNMGTFRSDVGARAIFDADAAQKYLARVADYPLPLDVALPIWSWTVHLRDDRVVGLLQSTDPAELAALPFLADAGPDRHVATRTAFLHGELIREGDVLAGEVTGPAETLAAARLVASHLAPPGGAPRTVSLFDLSERNLTRHGNDPLDQVFRAVR
jgi:hypothetical protein